VLSLCRRLAKRKKEFVVLLYMRMKHVRSGIVDEQEATCGLRASCIRLVGRVRTPAPPALLLLRTTPPLHNNVFADSLQPDLKNNAKTVQLEVNEFPILMHNARVKQT
jgi:hypothetical protein